MVSCQVATRFEEDYGVKKVSVGEAMRMVLETQSNTELAQLILGELRRGHVVPQELEVRALEVVVLDMRCQIRGYILDGYPMTLRQAELLDMHKIVPGRIINLELEDQTILSRGKQDRNSSTRAYPLHDSEAILRTKLEAFQANKESILQWYRTEHHNVTSLDSGQNKWWVWKHAVDVTRADVCQRQKYIERTEQGKAASMADMGLTRKEFLERLGDIGEYCPVSLSRGELVDGSRNPSLKFAAQFQGCHYKLAGQQELEEFLTEPSKFLPPLARFRLPSPNLLPVRHKKDEVQEITEVEMKGYCPVTFLDGLCRYEALVLGDPELIVEYRKKFYYMETEEKLLKFMRIPETYWNLVLPHKVPPRKDPVPITSLPNLGYLEQGVATALIAALTAAGNFKPKYPFVSATRSALLYIAYHLKAFNPKSSDYLRKKYKQKLRNFEESCNIIQYLGNAMTSRYREPSEWSAEFASKLEIFFALKGIEPTGNWIL